MVITGLSGSGKSTALKAFEDIGFFCIDNLPATLLPRFLELRDQISREVFKIALVMDLRGKDFLANFPKIFQEVKRKGNIVEVLFLEADEEILIRRYSQTRRHHPLGDHRILSGHHSIGKKEDGTDQTVGDLSSGHQPSQCSSTPRGDHSTFLQSGPAGQNDHEPDLFRL